MIFDYIPSDTPDYFPPRFTTHKVGDHQLFDLKADPLETRDISAEQPDIIGELLGNIAQLESEMQSPEIVFEGSKRIVDRCQATLYHAYKGREFPYAHDFSNPRDGLL